jgi:hypothetical protein
VTAIPWDQVLAAAQAGAAFLPPPWNAAASLATAIARGLIESGCTVEGCDVELLAPRAPDLRGEALADEIELDRIATGTDKASIRRRLRGDADEVLDPVRHEPPGPVATTSESPDADEVYGRG